MVGRAVCEPRAHSRKMPHRLFNFFTANAIGAACSLGTCFFMFQNLQENGLPVSYCVRCITWIVVCMPFLVLALSNTKKVGEASSDSNWRMITVPKASDNYKHAMLVKMTGIAQKHLLPITRSLRPKESQAYAAGLATIRRRAIASVPISATCQCGAVEVRVASGARHVFTCHCTMCADQTKTRNGKAPTWTAVSRQACLVRGALDLYFSSALGRRGSCVKCGDAILMDYSAAHTLYIAGASPVPADIELDEQERAAGNMSFEPCADADIFWKYGRPDALPTSRNVFDDMPLGKMGFVRDPGRSLDSLTQNP